MFNVSQKHLEWAGHVLFEWITAGYRKKKRFHGVLHAGKRHVGRPGGGLWYKDVIGVDLKHAEELNSNISTGKEAPVIK